MQTQVSKADTESEHDGVPYPTVESLTSTLSKPCGALEEYKPHLLIGVPKIFDVIMKGAIAKIAAEPRKALLPHCWVGITCSALKRSLINAAFESKANAIESRMLLLL